MARRITRPMALPITWVIAPLGVSAHAMTFVAFATAVASTAAFACGTTWSWLIGAGLLQAWYLLDHVDGQLARYTQRETLDGAALDYLMHHWVNVLLPLGLGWGLFRQSSSGWWMLAGVVAGFGLLTLGLRHDVRHKSFNKRLKRVRGELRVIGGGGKPSPQPRIPRSWKRLSLWAGRKACEVHVLMNLLTLGAIVSLTVGDPQLVAGKVLLAMLAGLSSVLAFTDLARGLRAESAEQEFAAWYRPPDDQTLTLQDGWWDVIDCDSTRPEPRSGTTSS